ncbi:hypothetical protein O1L44_02150 [Streptomyces noursei]|uniref:hypothetical protein n=1 Tax=Streptomyces noursei TaxID=1971 RepID=UPI00081C7684|nr:hypothetical protein SNOUR_07245 [Streptomyces noursei ATCC 11455]MCZ0992171.1 hypothetical protein [Streptomyces noursei]
MPGRGLDAIADPEHRATAAGVLVSGLVDEIIAMTDSFDGVFDRDRVRAEVEALAAEFVAAGLACPTAHISHLTVMRGLMLPIADSSLSCALSRVWVLATYADDVVACRDRAEAEAILRAGMLADRPVRSPLAGAMRRALDEVGRFCDPTFLAVYKSLYYRSVVGVLMEAEFTPTVSDEIDTEYVRVLTGFCDFWFITLQFAAPCLHTGTNWGFWTAALSSMVAFLDDFNDVLSFSKEAINGTDFRASLVYRRSVQENISYLDSYRRTLDGGVAAYRRILRLATDEQRPHLDRYMTGFIYWHLRSARYGWQAIQPSLTPLDTAL